MSGFTDMTGRIGMMLGLAKIRATRTDRGRGRATMTAQVQIPETGEIRDDTPVLGLYGVTSRPKAGADAALIFLGGNRGAGIVIATSDGRFSVEITPGEVAIHDDLGQKVHLTREGIRIKGGGLPMIIENTPLLTLKTNLRLEGNLTMLGAGGTGTATMTLAANVSITGATLTHNAANVGSSHTHGGVVSGGGNTGMPG